MFRVKKLAAFIVIICIAVLLAPPAIHASTTTLSLCWDSTGSDPNGMRWGDNYHTPNNWDVNRVLFNKTWDSCVTFKVGFKIDNSSTNPPLNMEYRLYAYDGTSWLATDAANQITQKNTEYVFEPVFTDPVKIQAFAIYPTTYCSSSYSWSYQVIPYSMTEGFPDQSAIISDFEFNVGQSNTVFQGSNTEWYEDYSYSRNFHFYDMYIIKINNKYYLKGRYWVTGDSRIAWWYAGGGGFVYYMAQYQTSNVTMNVNSVKLGDYNMAGTPPDDSGIQTAVLRSQWYYPDGTAFTIALGTSKPSTVSFQAVHSGTGGQYVQTLPQTTTYHNVSVSINLKPSIDSISQPLQGQVFSEADTSLEPVITVSDGDNQTLTCKYFVDDETAARDIRTVSGTGTAQTVSFTGFNAGSLSDGTHVIRFEAGDGCDMVRKHAVIKVDRRPPAIKKTDMSSTDSSITVTGIASDTVSDASSLTYNYTFNQDSSGWITDSSYTKGSLLPNTQYTVNFGVKDEKEHTSEFQGVYYTRAQLPSLTLGNITTGTIDLQISDSNPAATEYQIKAGEAYVDASGKLTATPVWLSPAGKAITVRGLYSGTAYSFQVKARNGAGVETSFCTAVTGTTN